MIPYSLPVYSTVQQYVVGTGNTVMANVDSGSRQSMVFVDDGEILVTNDRWIIIMDINLDDCKLDFERIFKFEQNLRDKLKEYRADTDTKEHTLFKELVENMIDDWEMELDLFEQEYWTIRTQFESLIYALIPKKSRKQKRQFETGGKILKFLFGTMDQNDFVRINTKLDKLEANNELFRHLI